MVYYLFRIAGYICPRLPPSFGYWLSARLGDLAFLFAARTQPMYFLNLRRVLGKDATPAQLNAVAHRGFQNLFKNYFDLFRGHAMTRDTVHAQVLAVNGLGYLENAIKQGKGVIGGSGHFGTWDMIVQVASVYLDTRIVVPNERLKPEKLNRYILRLRSRPNIEIIPIDVAPRAMIKALKAGQMVGLAYDRDITRTGPIVNFFGAPTQMPDGAVQLALKYGSPVIMGFSVRQADNRSVVYIEPPLQFSCSGNLEVDICSGVQQMAAILEKYIRQYPDQWLMFQKIWDETHSPAT
jgi:KDO2-lipid IV(A) lauroyltransferase